MNIVSTDSIPLKNDIYKETGEAYYPFAFSYGNKVESAPNELWREHDLSDYNICSALSTDRIAEMLICQYKKVETFPQKFSFVAFVLNRALQEITCNISTAPVEEQSLRLLRQFASGVTQRESEISEIVASRVLYDAPKVKTYLLKHPSIVKVLEEGISKVREIFGSGTYIELEVVSDPEVTEYKKLFVYIVTSQVSNMALEFLDRLDSEWYLNLSDETLDLISFNIRSV